MRISNKHFAYRWAYLLTDSWNQPTQVSLCKLTWRFIGMTPGNLLILALFALFAPIYLLADVLPKKIRAAYWRKRYGTDDKLSVLYKLDAKWRARREAWKAFWKPIKENIWVQMLLSLKGKMCPIIEVIKD